MKAPNKALQPTPKTARLKAAVIPHRFFIMLSRQLLSILSICLIFLGCHLYGPPPGKGPKAEKFFEEAAPIISALELYKIERGSYPESIDDLIPKYIPEKTSRKFYYVTENDTN